MEVETLSYHQLQDVKLILHVSVLKSQIDLNVKITHVTIHALKLHVE